MNAPHRRGACPGISSPMQTGDGLLVRLMPIGTMALEAFAKLCAAAQAHGNGVVEVTARGSIQVRGLTAASAPAFAAGFATLGIAAQDGVAVLTNALADLDPAAMLDVAPLAVKLRDAIAARPLAARLAAKVSVVVDGGGVLHLDVLAADVRLRAQKTYGDVRFHLAIGGDGASATPIGVVEGGYEIEAALRLLEVIAARLRRARAKDILQDEGPGAFRTAVADLLIRSPPFPPRAPCEAVGTHPVRYGDVALGIGLAFGHADARVLERLTEAAGNAGASGIRAAPGRVLLFLGLVPDRARSLAAVAEHLGFIVGPHDPRRNVIACAGAPICASANIPARAIAPVIADAAAGLLDGSLTIHLSGCAKGCAHAGVAALTIIGRALGCGLVVNGTARDDPTAVLSTDALPSRLASLAREIERERRPGENAAQTFARMADRTVPSMQRGAENG